VPTSVLFLVILHRVHICRCWLVWPWSISTLAMP
jgi:hypothetical protein